jgi:hypothetical protein
MGNKFWKYFAYGYFAATTLGLITLVEMLIYRIPYFSIFLLIFGLVYASNLKTD